MYYTSGVALGALVYVIATNYLLGSFMITNPAVLGSVLFCSATAALSIVYGSRKFYLQTKSLFDGLAIISGIIVSGMTVYVGMWAQVAFLAAIFVIAFIASNSCVSYPKDLYLKECIITYAIASSVIGLFCLTVLKSPADFMLTIKYQHFGKYSTEIYAESSSEFTILFFLFLFLNGTAFRVVYSRMHKHKESKMVESLQNG